MTQPSAKRTGRIATASLAALLTVSCASEAQRPVTEAANGRQIATAQPVGEAEASENATAYGAYLAGLYANSQRDLTAAARYMSRALEADPDNPRLLHNTFMLVAGEGQMDAVEPVYYPALTATSGYDYFASLVRAGVERPDVSMPAFDESRISEEELRAIFEELSR